MTSPSPARHGYAAYTNGCRCETCREAKRVYVRERRRLGLERDERVGHARKGQG